MPRSSSRSVSHYSRRPSVVSSRGSRSWRSRSPARSREVSFVRPLYRGSTSRTGSAAVSSASKSSKEVKILERLEKAEKVNTKLQEKAKEKKFKFTKPACETQF